MEWIRAYVTEDPALHIPSELSRQGSTIGITHQTEHLVYVHLGNITYSFVTFILVVPNKNILAVNMDTLFTVTLDFRGRWAILFRRDQP